MMALYCQEPIFFDVALVENVKNAYQNISHEHDCKTIANTLFDYAAILNRGLLDYQSSCTLRQTPVRISGAKYIPPIPTIEEVRITINKINNYDYAIDKAVAALLFISKGQFFLDGNKRLGLVISNRIMFHAGENKLFYPNVDETALLNYRNILVNYYDQEISFDEAKSYLLTCCLHNCS